MGRKRGMVMDRQMLLAALGEFPPKAPLQPVTLESVDCDSYMRELVEYSTEPGERVRAYVCLPKERNAKTAAIFCHHQHDWNFKLGKSEVVGLDGDVDQYYAMELAQRGYITFAPDAIGFEDRNWSGGTFETSYFELATRLVGGRTLAAKVLSDAFAGIDYLESREEVDREKIGFLGHSYGGRMAIWVPALDRRIRASVSNCGCIPYQHSLSQDVGIQMEFCIPGITSIGDLGDIVVLVAPTPLYISAGRDDRWSHGAQQIAETAAQYFPSGRFKLKVWPVGHAFTKPMRLEAYDFLDSHLLI